MFNLQKNSNEFEMHIEMHLVGITIALKSRTKGFKLHVCIHVGKLCQKSHSVMDVKSIS